MWGGNLEKRSDFRLKVQPFRGPKEASTFTLFLVYFTATSTKPQHTVDNTNFLWTGKQYVSLLSSQEAQADNVQKSP